MFVAAYFRAQSAPHACHRLLQTRIPQFMVALAPSVSTSRVDVVRATLAPLGGRVLNYLPTPCAAGGRAAGAPSAPYMRSQASCCFHVAIFILLTPKQPWTTACSAVCLTMRGWGPRRGVPQVPCAHSQVSCYSRVAVSLRIVPKHHWAAACCGTCSGRHAPGVRQSMPARGILTVLMSCGAAFP